MYIYIYIMLFLCCQHQLSASASQIQLNSDKQTYKNPIVSLFWRQEVLVHLLSITHETGEAENTIWFDQLCPFKNCWTQGGLLIVAVIRARHCFWLPMRINRGQILYLVTEASEILSLQHGFGHVGPFCRQTWHLFPSAPAKGTYLLAPLMYPAHMGHCRHTVFKR